MPWPSCEADATRSHVPVLALAGSRLEHVCSGRYGTIPYGDNVARRKPHRLRRTERVTAANGSFLGVMGLSLRYY